MQRFELKLDIADGSTRNGSVSTYWWTDDVRVIRRRIKWTVKVCGNKQWTCRRPRWNFSWTATTLSKLKTQPKWGRLLDPRASFIWVILSLFTQRGRSRAFCQLSGESMYPRTGARTKSRVFVGYHRSEMLNRNNHMPRLWVLFSKLWVMPPLRSKS